MEDGPITTKEVGNYRIKIYYDTDSACPCESWDMAACFLWECIYLPRLQDVCDWREVFGKYGDSRHSLMGEHYYNKFVHEFDGNILKMIGYFRGSEKDGQVFCDMITERIEKYEKRMPYDKGKLNN